MKENFSHSQYLKVKNVNFSMATLDDLLQQIEKNIRDRGRKYISITNTESLYWALELEEHKKYVNSSEFSCCDGIAVQLAAKLAGYHLPRIHGPDLMLKCCEVGQEKGWKHFFYGGKLGVPEVLADNLKRRFPGMNVAGTYSPPFRELTQQEELEITEFIKNSGADFVWVGMGLLKQERWIALHLDKIGVPWMIGVGAAFDFYAGTVKRAPIFFQRIGLEWLYRVVFEPRMIPRHYRALKTFLKLLVARDSFNVVNTCRIKD